MPRRFEEDLSNLQSWFFVINAKNGGWLGRHVERIDSDLLMDSCLLLYLRLLIL